MRTPRLNMEGVADLSEIGTLPNWVFKSRYWHTRMSEEYIS